MKLEISRHIFKNPQIPNFMKIRRFRAELFDAGGRSDKQTSRS